MLKDKFKYKQLSHENKTYYVLDLSFSFDDYDWYEGHLTYNDYRMNNESFVTALIILNEMRWYNLYDLNWDLFDYLIWELNFKEISQGERPYGISDFIFQRHIEEDGKCYIEDITIPSLKEVFDDIPESVKKLYGLVSPDLTKNKFKLNK